MFTDRTDAGRQLGDLLDSRDVEVDIVLGIPRGALPVARPVADRLGVPLDITVAQKMGAPNNPELAIGAVASDGSAWLNDDLIERLSVSDGYVEEERERTADDAKRKLERYRGDRGPPDLSGKAVVIVDDGLATGATARACLRQVRDAGARRLVLAVPVGSPDSTDRIEGEGEADEVIVIESPTHFSAVGQFYESFGQVSDEEAMEYLNPDEPSER